jgi:hypothetical protein
VPALPLIAMGLLALGIAARVPAAGALTLGWIARELAVVVAVSSGEEATWIVGGLGAIALLLVPWRRAERTFGFVAIAAVALAVNVAWFDSAPLALAGLAALGGYRLVHHSIAMSRSPVGIG